MKSEVNAPSSLRAALIQYWLQNSNELTQSLWLALMRSNQGWSAEEFTIQWDELLATRIKESKYDWAWGKITSDHLPIQSSGIVATNLILIHFNHTMKTTEILKTFGIADLQPARLPELLAFSVKYPTKQWEFPIVALGSLWPNQNGYQNVAFLYKNSDELGLRQNFLGDNWGDCYRFLATYN